MKHEPVVRVAFTLFGDNSWTGGINYLRNLISALSELPARTVEVVLFIDDSETSNDAVEALRPYLSEPPIVVSAWLNTVGNKIRQLLEKGLLHCDKGSLTAFQAANIDVVFQNDTWYGFAFPLPTIAWIADFQHKHLHDMFTFYRKRKRDLAYSVLCRSASKIMVSSEDAGQDCQTFFPASVGKVTVLPFAVQIDETVLTADISGVIKEYDIPRRFFYFPGQLWRHKNHLALLDALCLLKKMGSDVLIVGTGNPQDRRNPEHPEKVLQMVASMGLQDSFLFLGMVPYSHIMPLMRASAAVVNPSLFEGWSTTVEEAKALGVPMLLSDLKVHREQAPETCRFFDPRDPKEMAKVMSDAWQEWEAGPRFEIEKIAYSDYVEQRKVFAQNFVKLVRSMISN